MLLLVVFTGFAALSGNLKVPQPDNFSTFDGAGAACPQVSEDASGRAADFALALMQVLYSYSGWENANYVSCHASLIVDSGTRDVLTNEMNSA